MDTKEKIDDKIYDFINDLISDTKLMGKGDDKNYITPIPNPINYNDPEQTKLAIEIYKYFLKYELNTLDKNEIIFLMKLGKDSTKYGPYSGRIEALITFLISILKQGNDKMKSYKYGKTIIVPGAKNLLNSQKGGKRTMKSKRGKLRKCKGKQTKRRKRRSM